MASEILTTTAQQNERFRMVFQRSRFAISTAYLALGAIYIGTGSRTLRLPLGVLYLGLACWSLAAHISVYWELRGDGLFEHRLWRTRVVPYRDITVVRNLEDDNRGIEVRYATFNAATFPHGSMGVLVADRAKFLGSLHALAPSADFRV